MVGAVTVHGCVGRDGRCCCARLRGCGRSCYCAQLRGSWQELLLYKAAWVVAGAVILCTAAWIVAGAVILCTAAWVVAGAVTVHVCMGLGD